MATEAEFVLVGTVATVCTFIITFWLGHIDRLWTRYEREKIAISEGRTKRDPKFFETLGLLAKQSRLIITLGGGLLLGSLGWLFFVILEVPRGMIPGSLMLAVFGFFFTALAVRVWWREFRFFEQAIAGETQPKK